MLKVHKSEAPSQQPGRYVEAFQTWLFITEETFVLHVNKYTLIWCTDDSCFSCLAEFQVTYPMPASRMSHQGFLYAISSNSDSILFL